MIRKKIKYFTNLSQQQRDMHMKEVEGKYLILLSSFEQDLHMQVTTKGEIMLVCTRN